MAATSDGARFGQDDSIYRPTSLAFIHRPNPIEPQSAPQRHPLDGTHASQEIRNVFHSRRAISNNERPQKRPKYNPVEDSTTKPGSQFLDLPRLPIRQDSSRLRIPPTLSGLHQPPPNAGLLPSISTEEPVESQTESLPKPTHGTDSTSDQIDANKGPATKKSQPKPSGKTKRNKWTEEETSSLLKAVSHYGIGAWTKILNSSEYAFPRRTAHDLKDRFRVCCPDEYKSRFKPGESDKGKPAKTSSRKSDLRDGQDAASKSRKKPTPELQDSGVSAIFAQNNRRKRRGYTESEDIALLKGFKIYGNAWALIRRDEALDLTHRKPTDLRDRFRTRYPEEYAKIGLAPRPEIFPKPPKRAGDLDEKGEGSGTEQEKGNAAKAKGKGAEVADNKDDQGLCKPDLKLQVPDESTPASTAKRTQATPLSSLYSVYDDVFFGAPSEDGGFEAAERITLDRGILDWPSHVVARLPAPSEMLKAGGIDPLATLMKSTAGKMQQNHSSAALPSLNNTSAAALPSLASVTAAGLGTDDDDEQLELPSLVGFDALEQDGRVSGQFLGLDELLS